MSIANLNTKCNICAAYHVRINPKQFLKFGTLVRFNTMHLKTIPSVEL